MKLPERDTKGRFRGGPRPWQRKPWIDKVCPKCGTEFSVPPCLDRVVSCSPACRHKGNTFRRGQKVLLKGPLHWNWKNGSSTERRKAMMNYDYKHWRRSVFERDNFTCQMCSRRGVYLNADHILPWSTHPDKRYDISNGRTLCLECHWQTPTFAGRLKGVSP